MNRRSLSVVGAIAVVAVLLAILGQRQSAPVTDSGSTLLPGLAAALNEVERIVVRKAGAETVATLVRDASGWHVAERDSYPADVAKIRQALVALAEAKIVEEKTSDPAFYDRLGVEAIERDDASGAAIEITAESTAFPVLIVGDAVNSSSRYVRPAAEERSLLIDRNPDLARNTPQWLVPDIVDVRGPRVQRVTITHADGEELVISKSAAAEANFAVSDIPEGRELLYPGVANVVGNALRELKLDDVARATEEDGDPVAVTEFRTFDGLVVTMTGRLYGEEAWVSFTASVDDGAADAQPAGAEPAAAAASSEAQPASDPSAEAASINARVGGWRYRIPAHQYDQLTRRLADLLKAPA